MLFRTDYNIARQSFFRTAWPYSLIVTLQVAVILVVKMALRAPIDWDLKYEAIAFQYCAPLDLDGALGDQYGISYNFTEAAGG